MPGDLAVREKSARVATATLCAAVLFSLLFLFLFFGHEIIY